MSFKRGLFFLGMFLILFFSCKGEKYVEFKRVVDDSENNYYESTITDSVYREQVKITLKKYSVEFKEVDGKIYVLREIYLNQEFCKNLSQKAKYVELD